MLLPRYRYPSDTSDLEWALLKPLLPTPSCQTPKGVAPEKWPRRRVVDAIRYITDNGAKWRALPADFGIPWRTVFGYFARWSKAGVLKRILDQLRRRLRLHRRRCPWPVRVIVDSGEVVGALLSAGPGVPVPDDRVRKALWSGVAGGRWVAGHAVGLVW